MLRRRNRASAVSAAIAQRRLEALANPSLAAETRRLADGDHDDQGDVDVDTPSLARLRAAEGRHAAAHPRQPRWLALTTQQITLIAVATALVVLVAAWWVMHAVPRAESVQLAHERIVPSQPAPTGTADEMPADSAATRSATTATTAAGVVVVDVAGKVREPGIVELPVGSRVIDAIKAAGGVRAGVPTPSLNLARMLVDGEQIVVGAEIPAMPSAPSSAGSTAALAPINLNTATQEQLEALPGIGPVTAQAILQWRSEHAAFTSVDELLEVSGIGDATLADIEAYVYV